MGFEWPVVLDHLIVQRMEQTESEAPDEVESILKFGARALFEEEDGKSSTDIHYSPADIEKLLDRSEADKGTTADKDGDRSSKAFSYARIVSPYLVFFCHGGFEPTEMLDEHSGNAIHRNSERFLKMWARKSSTRKNSAGSGLVSWLSKRRRTNLRKRPKKSSLGEVVGSGPNA
jgi:hypothetical protein